LIGGCADAVGGGGSGTAVGGGPGNGSDGGGGKGGSGNDDGLGTLPSPIVVVAVGGGNGSTGGGGNVGGTILSPLGGGGKGKVDTVGGVALLAVIVFPSNSAMKDWYSESIFFSFAGGGTGWVLPPLPVWLNLQSRVG
jgi:hypothetical protein